MASGTRPAGRVYLSLMSSQERTFLSTVARRAGLVALALLALVGLATALSAFRGYAGDPSTSMVGLDELPPIPAEVAAGASAARHGAPMPLPDSLYGASGALRFRTLTPAEALALPGFLERFGERALKTPAVRLVASARDTGGFALIVLRPFGAKRGEVLNGYRLGRWPAERFMMARNYFNPDGFVEVTPEDAALPLSLHFTLGDFLTHDQRAVWPKYVVLEEKLIDKLELVLADLAAHGVPTGRVKVLSGFRAPYYNDRGVGEGMARASRHQFGDAVDIIVDDDGDGRMDDLNGDGRRDVRDTEPLVRARARGEKRHPALVGGVGTYQATGPSGPFAHIDVRGTSARWERRNRDGKP